MIVRLTFPDTPLEVDNKSDETANNEAKTKKQEEDVSAECHGLYSEYPSRSPRVWFPPVDSESAAQEQGSSEFKNPVAIWLSSAKEPHGSCSRLHMMALPTENELITLGGWESEESAGSEPASSSNTHVETVIDSVWEPPCPVDEGGFPGLYVGQLPARPFLFLGGVLHVACVSSWGCSQNLLVVRLAGDYVEPALAENVTPPKSYVHGSRKHEIVRLQLGERSSTSFVSCYGTRIVAVASTLTEPNEVFVTDLKGASWGDVAWSRITNVGERGMVSLG